LRYSGAKAGDLVAILGLGGLGHLAVQFARKLVFKTVALSRGTEKQELAYTLGAHVYIDTESSNPAMELQNLAAHELFWLPRPTVK